MAPRVPIPGTPEHTEAFREFHLQFGLTLSAWAQLEHRLGFMFCWLTGLGPGPAGMGAALFFSGRSFATRADLLSAAIRSSNRPVHQKALYRALLKKARTYSSARNTIAHGIPIALFGSGPYQGMRIKEGDSVWLDGGVSLNQLMEAMANFAELQKLVIRACDPSLTPEQCEECIREVQALPTSAYPLEDERNSEERD